MGIINPKYVKNADVVLRWDDAYLNLYIRPKNELTLFADYLIDKHNAHLCYANL